jgi:hypothetical protein
VQNAAWSVRTVILACIWVGSIDTMDVFAQQGAASRNQSKLRIAQNVDKAARIQTLVAVHK